MVSGQDWRKMKDKLVGQHYSNQIANNQLIDTLFSAVSNAEMGPEYLKKLGYDHPYIRTSASTAGSSAYGPLQMTGGAGSMIASILNNPLGSESPHLLHKYKGGFSDDEMNYMAKFLQQGQKFLDYGNEPGKEGYDPRYEYSGKGAGSGLGDLSGEADRLLYDSISKKILDYEFNQQAGGDPMKFLKNWKMGSGKSMDDFNTWAQSPEAQAYINRFSSIFGM